MKTKLTLSIDAALMDDINRKAKLDKGINLSKMVEGFLFGEFKRKTPGNKSTVKSLRGILKETDATRNWKQEKIERLSEKHLR